MTERNGFRVSWVVLVTFLLGLMGTGYAMLDARKADRETVAQMAADIREIRAFDCNARNLLDS